MQGFFLDGVWLDIDWWLDVFVTIQYWGMCNLVFQFHVVLPALLSSNIIVNCSISTLLFRLRVNRNYDNTIPRCRE
jgi:hypothetical protein